MHFKITEGSETYQKLSTLIEKIKEANEAAKTLALSFGAKQWCLDNSHFIIAGGLSGLRLADKPKNWKKVFTKSYSDVYFPADKGAAKEAYKAIKALPVVQAKELADIVGFEEQELPVGGGTIKHFTYPGFTFGNGNYLLYVLDQLVYNPKNADIVEITSSEFKKLSAYEPDATEKQAEETAN